MPEALLAPLAIGGFAMAVLALLLVLLLLVRLGRGGRRSGEPGTGDVAVDRLLADERQRVEALRRELNGLADELRRVEAEGQRAMKRVGIVRFNPFEDTGGNQSFAVALLDGQSNGLVVSSLHSRQQTRVYLKAIRAGTAESALSDEEAEALRRAVNGTGADFDR
jgi:hypothetical protein